MGLDHLSHSSRMYIIMNMARHMCTFINIPSGCSHTLHSVCYRPGKVTVTVVINTWPPIILLKNTSAVGGRSDDALVGLVPIIVTLLLFSLFSFIFTLFWHRFSSEAV